MEDQKKYGNTSDSSRTNQGMGTPYQDRNEGNLNTDVPKSNINSNQNYNSDTTIKSPDKPQEDNNYPNPSGDVNPHPSNPGRDENREDKNDEFDESNRKSADEFSEKNQKRERQNPEGTNLL